MLIYGILRFFDFEIEFGEAGRLRMGMVLSGCWWVWTTYLVSLNSKNFVVLVVIEWQMSEIYVFRMLSAWVVLMNIDAKFKVREDEEEENEVNMLALGLWNWLD